MRFVFFAPRFLLFFFVRELSNPLTGGERALNVLSPAPKSKKDENYILLQFWNDEFVISWVEGIKC